MSTEELSVTAVQVAASTDPTRNRQALAAQIPSGLDLVVLPEGCSRDFGDGEDLSADAESIDGPFGTEVTRLAGERGTTVVAGMFEVNAADPARPLNTLLVRGQVNAEYRKVHLYDAFGFKESDRVTGGPLQATVVDLAGWQVGLMTCYDLRFPEMARLVVDAGAEVLVVPAAWVAGERKVDHWRTLVRARAIENTVFVVAVGQPGPRYSGHSMIVDPAGDVLAEAGEGAETISAVMRRDVMDDVRATNPSLLNRRL